MDHEEEVAFLHVRVGQQLVDVVGSAPRSGGL